MDENNRKGHYHLYIVDHLLFPKDSKRQKDTFSSFKSFNSLKGLKLAPRSLITEPPESGPLLIRLY